MQQKNWFLFRSVFVLFLGVVLLFFSLISSAQAAPEIKIKSASNVCINCHKDEGLEVAVDGESVSATIDPAKFEKSVHAEEKVDCADCHANIKSYPHPKIEEKSLRAHSQSLNTACKECHEEQFEKAQDSAHLAAFQNGEESAAICSNCHNPHTSTRFERDTKGEITFVAIQRLIQETCSQCHAEIYGKYQESVHGKALSEEGNDDVPTCINCHGVHNVQGGTTSFHNSTPALCGKCHSNAEIMDKYDISTHVIDTYVADFHGATVKIFEEQFPDQPTNKAVCTDCHGVHDITKTDDPKTGVGIQENLLGKCQRCHPDAGPNFPAAWMSHYEPSPEHYPIVYYVNLFYKFFIPTVLGSMILFVLSDIYRSTVPVTKRVASIVSKEENDYE